MLVLGDAYGAGLVDGLPEVQGLVRLGVGFHGNEALEGAVRPEGSIVLYEQFGHVVQRVQVIASPTRGHSWLVMPLSCEPCITGVQLTVLTFQLL